MENRNENFLSMLNLLITVWLSKQSTLESIIAVKNVFLELNAVKLAIAELATQQSEAIGGKTIDKRELHKKMCALSAQIGQIIAVYAYTTENEDLRKSVNFSLTHYNRLRDDEVAMLCSIVSEKAENNKTELVNYGITQAMIEELNGYITLYSGTSQLNLLQIKQRKIYTQQLRDLFNDARKIVYNKLDGVMMIFQFSHHEVYQLYLEARNSMPKRKAKKSTGEETNKEAATLTGIISDKTDETPIKNAVVKLIGTGFSTETNETGEYLFDTLPEGTYHLEVTATGYKKISLTNQKVSPGVERVADFVMDKNLL